MPDYPTSERPYENDAVHDMPDFPTAYGVRIFGAMLLIFELMRTKN
jgi:hypothetical protein